MKVKARRRRAWRAARSASLALLCAALVVLVLHAGSQMAQASTSASPSSSSDTFRVGWMLEPDNLNPYIGLLGQDYEIWHLNYDWLVGFNPKDLSPRPEIATSWSVSPDGKVWTFQIRKGVKWQDGVPLTASDVAFSFNYIVKNNLTTLTVYTNGITKAVATGPYTVKVYTSRPKSNMTAMDVPIVPAHIWSKVSGKAATTSFQNSPPIVGSGPFQVVQWVKGSFIRLVANKNYWGGAPKIKQLIFETYTNANSMVDDLKLGAIDAATDVPEAQFKALESTPGITTIKGASFRFNELAFNCYNSPSSLGNPILLDTKFRQALAWAIDPQKICQVAFDGFAVPGSTILLPYTPYFWQVPAAQAYHYDPAKADALLTAAGYKMGANGVRLDRHGKPIKLRLYVTSDSPEDQIAAHLIAGWFQQVGIKVTLTVMDAGTLINDQYNYQGKTYRPDWDMFVWFWTNDSNPTEELSNLTSGEIGGWSDTCWTNPAYDRLDAQFEAAMQLSAQIPIAQRLQQMAYQACPYLVFAYPYRLEAYRSGRWTGVVTSPSNVPGYEGSAFYNYENIDTYRFVQPVTATSTSSGGSGSTIYIVIGVVAAAVVVGLLWTSQRRRRGRQLEG
jgi:peptide/nickel transport system substrate-binding protein